MEQITLWEESGVMRTGTRQVNIRCENSLREYRAVLDCARDASAHAEYLLAMRMRQHAEQADAAVVL